MISLVVPTYNERGNVAALVERTGKALAATGEPFELIISDDNSPDGTAELVRSLQADRPWLRLLVRTTDRGLSNAVIAGWGIARGDVLGCMDADLQHPPEVLTRLSETLQSTSSDIVVGSRHVQGGGVSEWSLVRRFISWTATFMAALILPGTLGEVRDPMSGFFLLRCEVIRGAALRARGYKILLEVLAKGHYSKVREVPFIFEERVEGGSKIGASIMWDYLVHLGRISVETGEAARIAKFALVGLSGSFVNLFLYRWLVARPGWTIWLAATVAAGMAIINNFAWNEKFTFHETHQVFPGSGPLARRFVLFTLISLAGLALNVGVVELLVGRLHFPWLPGVAAGIGVAGAWNFFSNANVTWKPQRNKKPTLAASVVDAPSASHKPLVDEID